MADAIVSKAIGVTRGGSTPPSRTRKGKGGQKMRGVILCIIVMLGILAIGVGYEKGVYESKQAMAEEMPAEIVPRRHTQAEEYFENAEMLWNKINNRMQQDYNTDYLKIQCLISIAMYYQNQEIIELLKKRRDR